MNIITSERLVLSLRSLWSQTLLRPWTHRQKRSTVLKTPVSALNRVSFVEESSFVYRALSNIFFKKKKKSSSDIEARSWGQNYTLKNSKAGAEGLRRGKCYFCVALESALPILMAPLRPAETVPRGHSWPHNQTTTSGRHGNKPLRPCATSEGMGRWQSMCERLFCCTFKSKIILELKQDISKETDWWGKPSLNTHRELTESSDHVYVQWRFSYCPHLPVLSTHTFSIYDKNNDILEKNTSI